MNLKKLQMIMLMSVVAIGACYAHSARASEVVIYKCVDSQGHVRFQDTVCTALAAEEVIIYTSVSDKVTALRPAEQKALEQMHARVQAEYAAEVDLRKTKDQKPACNVDVKTNNYYRWW